MADSFGGRQGVLQVVTPAGLDRYDQARRQQRAAAVAADQQQNAPPELAGWIRGQFEIFRNHRNTASGWSNRLLNSLRTFNGQYDPTKLREILKFGGSQVYARISAQKCRAATSLLRDIYMGPDRPWGVKPPADPEIPPDILQKIDALLQQENIMIQRTGQPNDPQGASTRRMRLVEQARMAAKKKAADQARIAEDKIEEILRQGGFYHALAEFLVDLPIFNFAVIKGPTVKIIPEVVWPPNANRPTVIQKPVLTWNRVSPFDLWWTPGVADIANAAIIEKSRLTRAELNDLLDLPGSNVAEVRAVLQEYGRGGLYDNWDTTDAERAVLESRENPAWNRSAMITMMEFNGPVQGAVLQEYGMPGASDPERDYHIQAWVIGSHVIKLQMSPSPRVRHPYYMTSFEKVPGTPLGNGLIDIIADLQEAANATLRSLINNVSIASGPQVVVNDDRVRPEDNTDDLYPWKRWHATNDPVGNNQKPPVEFYQPNSNSQEMMAVFKGFVDLADDVSAIPRYIGGQTPGGAGRTASGLSMLMQNAGKLLQTVAANVDRDVFEGVLRQLMDMILLTDTSGLLTGEEEISVEGVDVAVQRETERQRQLEFLQSTNNPADQQIMGFKGRGAVLRSVSQTIGLDGEEIVPDDDTLDQKEQQAHAPPNPQIAIGQKIDQGVAQGIGQGVQAITKELTSGLLAQSQGVPIGPPVHEGALPGQGPLAQAAAQAQGNQPTPLTQGGMQTNTVSPQSPSPQAPGPGPNQPNPPPIGGGPG